MEFKIDTRANYTHITPVYTQLDAIMAAALQQKCTELADEGSQNFLIDLNACQDGAAAGFEDLIALHEACYASGRSLVFTGIGNTLMAAFKAAEVDQALNLAPTEIEAIDIISMEILERDLFNEES